MRHQVSDCQEQRWKTVLMKVGKVICIYNVLKGFQKEIQNNFLSKRKFLREQKKILRVKLLTYFLLSGTDKK